MNQPIKNQKGFTLIELVLFISLSAIVVGVTSYIMVNQIDAYSFVSNRQETLSDSRYAFNRAASELIFLDTAEITGIAASQIDFIDQNGLNTNFSSGASAEVAGEMALYRGNEILIDPIASLTFNYLDQNGLETAVIGEIRQILMTVTTEPVANEGALTLTTRVVPRNFVYENYQ